MILTNELRSLKSSKRALLEPAVTLLAPFAPHVAEELWQALGHSTSVCDAQWPTHNDAFLVTDSIQMPIQINGKMRGTVEIPNGMSNADLEQLVMGLDFVQRNLGGATVKKFVVVPGRIVNIVAG